MKDQKRFMVPPRSIVVLIGKKTPETAEKERESGESVCPGEDAGSEEDACFKDRIRSGIIFQTKKGPGHPTGDRAAEAGCYSG